VVQSMNVYRFVVEDTHGNMLLNEAEMQAQEASPSALLPPSSDGDGPSTASYDTSLTSLFSLLTVGAIRPTDSAR